MRMLEIERGRQSFPISFYWLFIEGDNDPRWALASDANREDFNPFLRKFFQRIRGKCVDYSRRYIK